MVYQINLCWKSSLLLVVSPTVNPNSVLKGAGLWENPYLSTVTTSLVCTLKQHPFNLNSSHWQAWILRLTGQVSLLWLLLWQETDAHLLLVLSLLICMQHKSSRIKCFISHGPLLERLHHLVTSVGACGKEPKAGNLNCQPAVQYTNI